jgi:hypothetical protein
VPAPATPAIRSEREMSSNEVSLGGKVDIIRRRRSQE